MNVSHLQAEAMLAVHERRLERVRTAWVASCEADAPEPHVVAWEQIGWLGRGFDSEEFAELVAADAQQHDTPLTFCSFVDHHNRLVPERAAIFSRRYMLDTDEPLGEGGFGRVLRGTRTDTEETYAIKCSLKSKLKDKARRNLESEIRLWSRVSHAGICNCYDVFELADQIVMVTELCVGGCLLDQLMDVEHFTEEDAKQISRQVSNAVVYLHENGIAHRDIKPENVLCTDKEPHVRGHIKLCDFGFAAEFSKEALADEGSAPKDFNQLIGTPEYLAPEMVEDFMRVRKREQVRSYTYKVDYWALGCLMFELFAGEPPYLSDDDEKQFELTLTAPLIFPPDQFDQVSETAQGLLRALLERNPSERLGMRCLTHDWLASSSPNPRHTLGDPQQTVGSGLTNRRLVAQTTMQTRKNRGLNTHVNKVMAARRLSMSSRRLSSESSEASSRPEANDAEEAELRANLGATGGEQ